MMFVSGLFNCVIAEYNVFVLPLPVGPVTNTIPNGLCMARSNFFSDSGSKPNRIMSNIRFCLSSNRRTK